ncbi:3-isopropylmalate dehydratase small subunit [soil metagenome]
MKAVNRISGKVVPMDRENVDTDAIMPKQFLKATDKLGFGANLFDSWRFLDVGGPGQDPATRIENPEFILNQPGYRDATVMVARDNFGCGSSREHAPWGLLQYGIEALLAPSFGDIFANNSLKNGLLIVRLSVSQIDALITSASKPGFVIDIDLQAQTVTSSEGHAFTFEIDPFRKQCLLQGADDIQLALSHGDKIKAYEARARTERPWSFEQVVL